MDFKKFKLILNKSKKYSSRKKLARINVQWRRTRKMMVVRPLSDATKRSRFMIAESTSFNACCKEPQFRCSRHFFNFTVFKGEVLLVFSFYSIKIVSVWNLASKLASFSYEGLTIAWFCVIFETFVRGPYWHWKKWICEKMNVRKMNLQTVPLNNIGANECTFANILLF